MSIDVFMNKCKQKLPYIISNFTSSHHPLTLITFDMDIDHLILTCYRNCSELEQGVRMFSQALYCVVCLWSQEQQEVMYRVYSDLCMHKLNPERREELFRSLKDTEKLRAMTYKHIHSFWYTYLDPARVIQQGIGQKSYVVKGNCCKDKINIFFNSMLFEQAVNTLKNYLQLNVDMCMHGYVQIQVNICLNLYMRYVLNPYEFVVRMMCVWRSVYGLVRDRERWLQYTCALLPSPLSFKVFQFLKNI
ncbi:hypothetical protein EON65_56805 [archaeon]|nr:MAG: hypothetical protein EON65_56805 [archaeon]